MGCTDGIRTQQRISGKRPPKFLPREEQLQRDRQNIAFRHLYQHYPALIRVFLSDLLTVEGYNEAVVGFGAGLDLSTVRQLAAGSLVPISPKIFFDVLGLYARVFCNFRHYRDHLWPESETTSVYAPEAGSQRLQ